MKKIINFFKTAKQKIGDFLFKNRFGTVMVFVGIIVAFWDFTTKFLFDGQQIPVLNGFFSIYSTYNTGGAWSIFSNATWLLIVFSILFIAGIIVFNYFLKTKTYFYAISVGLLLSGAICNLYDRIAFGYVRDFIKLDFINFPIFNVADICICVGVALLAVYFIFIAPKLEKKQEQVVFEQSEENQNNKLDESATQNYSNVEQMSEKPNDDIKTEETQANTKNIDTKQTKTTKTSDKAKSITKTSNKTTTKSSTVTKNSSKVKNISQKKQSSKKVKIDNAD